MDGLVEVAPIPPVPRHDLFVYGVPEPMRGRIRVGMRVRIPLGRQVRTGVVAGFSGGAPPANVRAVLDLLDDEPFLPDDLLELCRWTARYYLVSVAEVIATIVPGRVPLPAQDRVTRLSRTLDGSEEAGLARRAPARAAAYRALREAPGGMLSAAAARSLGIRSAALRALTAAGIAEVVNRESAPTVYAEPAPSARHTLTEAQAAAAGAIVAAIRAGRGSTFLLHGVTGSGKTEVFLAAAEEALATGRSVMVLVPEIALTHQLVDRVRSRFAGTVAVLHSGLAPGERWRDWRRIRNGGARVVVGARSAVFAPIERPGLIVVDEEHDPAYKQEEGVRYNARDLAVVRARLSNAAVVLASATPSAETFQAAQEGRHVLLRLPARPTPHPLPTVDVIDLRKCHTGRGNRALFSPALEGALTENLERRSQSLVFLNRRGFSTHLQCLACGTPATCPHCSVALTWHRADAALVCHHCRHHRPAPARCPDCGEPALEAFGVGTEQVEAALRSRYPAARVDRLDRDASRRASAQRRTLRNWHAGETDILVGTQMVSKGHDVPGVTLVAVLLADLSLNLPDFRAAERTLTLLVQVAGRAGRGREPGRVLIQALRPEHPAVAAAANHDYVGFMTAELERRRQLGYPPFARLVSLRLDGSDAARVERAAQDLAADLRRRARELALEPRSVLGPAPPPIERVRGRWRRHVLLRGADVPKLRTLARAARAWEAELDRAGVRLVVDVDPYSM